LSAELHTMHTVNGPAITLCAVWICVLLTYVRVYYDLRCSSFDV